MITVIVTYQIDPKFIGQNKENIQLFLEDFKKLHRGDFLYEVFTKDDGRTFVHFSTYKNEQIQADVLNVASFKEFQRQRDESGLNGSHKVEVLAYVGSTAEFILNKANAIL